MRFFQLALGLAALLFAATLMGQAQTDYKQSEIEQKKSREKFNGKTLYEWEKDLHDKDVSIVVQAIAALKFYGSAARGNVPFLLKATGHRDVSMRVNSVITLGFVGVDPKDSDTAVKALKDRLFSDTQQIVRYQAASTLMRFGSSGINAYDATQALLGLLRQENSSWEVRKSAATALGWVAWTDKGFDKQAFFGLLNATGDTCAEVRMAAVLSLILFGKPANQQDQRQEEKYLHALTRENQSKRVAVWAYVCLMRIAGQVSDNHLQAIGKFLKNSDPMARSHAARALAVIGPSAASQVPPLIEQLSPDEDALVLVWVIAALGNMGDKAKEAVPYLEKLKIHKDPTIRDAVAKALLDISEKKRMDDAPEKKKKN